MLGRAGPSSDHGGRELLGWGVLVAALGIAFVALVVEPTQASVPVGLDRAGAAEILEFPNDRVARPARDQGLAAVVSDPAEAAAVPADAAVPTPAPYVVAPTSLVAAPPALVPAGLRVRVARLGIDLPVVLGDTLRDTVLRSTPSGAAFLLPSSAPPGSGGNSYIYAHARVGMFLALWDARVGDVVEVTTASNEVRRYRVTEIHPRVMPTDVRYTLPSADERLTLQTSTGPGDADPRFVVVAIRGD